MTSKQYKCKAKFWERRDFCRRIRTVANQSSDRFQCKALIRVNTGPMVMLASIFDQPYLFIEPKKVLPQSRQRCLFIHLAAMAVCYRRSFIMLATNTLIYWPRRNFDQSSRRSRLYSTNPFSHISAIWKVPMQTPNNSRRHLSNSPEAYDATRDCF